MALSINDTKTTRRVYYVERVSACKCINAAATTVESVYSRANYKMFFFFILLQQCAAIVRSNLIMFQFRQAHVVSAFEQSLSNMTSRLQLLTATTEKKDSEILEMRQTIELLRKQSIQAGLTTAHMQSMGVQVNGQQKQAIQAAAQQNLLQQHNQKADTLPPLPPPNNGMQRHLSSDSMCSLNSISSGCSSVDKKKKKGWVSGFLGPSKFIKRFPKGF